MQSSAVQSADIAVEDFPPSTADALRFKLRIDLEMNGTAVNSKQDRNDSAVQLKCHRNRFSTSGVFKMFPSWHHQAEILPGQ